MLSYPLMLLASASLLQDWQTSSAALYATNGVGYRPLLNVEFFTAMFFVAGFAFIVKLLYDKRHQGAFAADNPLHNLVKYGAPALLFIALYNAFAHEIGLYWQLRLINSNVVVNPNTDNAYQLSDFTLLQKRSIWLLNYTMLFVGLLAFANLRWIKNRVLGMASMGLIALAGLAFLTQGLLSLSELREAYITQENAQYFPQPWTNVALRYVSIALFGGLLWLLHRYVKSNVAQVDLRVVFESALAVALLVLATAEFVHWMDLLGFDRSYKFGLSVLWGLYALAVIGIGIWKKKKHLRIGAMGLLAVTLAKLFLYDISHLNTISKTIVMVSLGLLLLVVSFLYNKYKHLIADEPHA
jgi:hypothetical protein